MQMQKKEIETIAKAKASRKGKNSPVIGENGLSATPGEISDITRRALTTALLWEPIDKKDPEAVQQRIIDYLNYCIDQGARPGNMGMYNAIGIDRRRVYEMLAKNPDGPVEVTIKKGMDILSEIRESLMSSGKLNPVTGIFWQKNFDGLKDIQEIELAPKQSLQAESTPEAIEQDIPIDID